MNLKYHALSKHLRQTCALLYVVTGNDPYLLQDALTQIKTAWLQRSECDKQSHHINNADDWPTLFEAARHYSLFADTILLDVHFDKKTLDAHGKKAIQAYLEQPNSECLVLIRAPETPIKQWQWLSTHDKAVVVQVQPFAPGVMQQWISERLTHYGLRFSPTVPALIQQTNHNNMLACAQVVEKLSLLGEPHISEERVLEHLSDNSDYSVYELIDACLRGDRNTSLHILRQASQNKTEPTLLLWLITQELRQLIQLTQLMTQAIPLATACNQLKIWSSRVSLYGMALKRLPLTKLYDLIQQAQQLDEMIKSSHAYIWLQLERMLLEFG